MEGQSRSLGTCVACQAHMPASHGTVMMGLTGWLRTQTHSQRYNDAHTHACTQACVRTQAPTHIHEEQLFEVIATEQNAPNNPGDVLNKNVQAVSSIFSNIKKNIIILVDRLEKTDMNHHICLK